MKKTKRIGYVTHLEGRFIDVFERSKEYFKAPGVFRIRKSALTNKEDT